MLGAATGRVPTSMSRHPAMTPRGSVYARPGFAFLPGVSVRAAAGWVVPAGQTIGACLPYWHETHTTARHVEGPT
jgi:hypothetical protein